MEKRSYLYGVSKFNVYGISENVKKIPLSYKILVSQNAKIATSLIFKDPKKTAINGDFLRGKKKLNEFLECVREKKLFKTKEFDDKVNSMNAFFDKLVEKRVSILHLENTEIFDMKEEDWEKQNKEFFDAEILKIDEVINNALLELSKLKQKKKVKEMWELLGIDYWSDSLHYDISNKPALDEIFDFVLAEKCVKSWLRDGYDYEINSKQFKTKDEQPAYVFRYFKKGSNVDRYAVVIGSSIVLLLNLKDLSAALADYKKYAKETRAWVLFSMLILIGAYILLVVGTCFFSFILALIIFLISFILPVLCVAFVKKKKVK